MKKYSAFQKAQITAKLTHPDPTEGRFANVSNVGQDAMDAGGLIDE
jgi:hypothetical protein